ncbi:replication initiator [Streptomyces sp. RKAG293]|uniref:replication initiator n=1 Tax=Streptomyces sp. RKAG293 TaxID=2893403 RepID=UPI0035A9612E
MSSLGGCAQPIRLEGHRTEIDAFTGEILRELKSEELPAGHPLVRCGNRLTTRCPSCAELYRQDTYQLITAGLRGGKTIPDQVTTHPRVFATFTAPSYGPVHGRHVNGSARCRCGCTRTGGLTPPTYQNTSTRTPHRPPHGMPPLLQEVQGTAGEGARDRWVSLVGQQPRLHHADRPAPRPRQRHPPHPLPRPPPTPGTRRRPRRHQGLVGPRRLHRQRLRPRPTPPATPSHRPLGRRARPTDADPNDPPAAAIVR